MLPIERSRNWRMPVWSVCASTSPVTTPVSGDRIGRSSTFPGVRFMRTCCRHCRGGCRTPATERACWRTIRADYSALATTYDGADQETESAEGGARWRGNDQLVSPDRLAQPG